MREPSLDGVRKASPKKRCQSQALKDEQESAGEGWKEDIPGRGSMQRERLGSMEQPKEVVCLRVRGRQSRILSGDHIPRGLVGDMIQYSLKSLLGCHVENILE